MRIYEQALSHREPDAHSEGDLLQDGNNTSALTENRQISASKLRISTETGPLGLNKIVLPIFMDAFA